MKGHDGILFRTFSQIILAALKAEPASLLGCIVGDTLAHAPVDEHHHRAQLGLLYGISKVFMHSVVIVIGYKRDIATFIQTRTTDISSMVGNSAMVIMGAIKIVTRGLQVLISPIDERWCANSLYQSSIIIRMRYSIAVYVGSTHLWH